MLCASASLALSSGPPSVRKYVSPDQSFELSIFRGYGLQTGKGKGSRSYIPVCHDESLVCITVPLGLYPGTNFQDAAVEVTLLPANSVQACLNPGKYEVSTKIIDGTRFLHAPIYGAAMSSDVAGDVYRGYKKRKCYELSLKIAFTNFKTYSPGAIKEFTSQEQKQLHAELERILASFRWLN